MKQVASPDPKFHAQVLSIVRRHWPSLVAKELMKLGPKPRKLEPDLEPAPIESKPVESPDQIAEALMKEAQAKPSIINWADPKMFADAILQHGSQIKAAKALGIAETTFRDRYRKAQTAAS